MVELFIIILDFSTQVKVQVVNIETRQRHFIISSIDLDIICDSYGFYQSI